MSRAAVGLGDWQFLVRGGNWRAVVVFLGTAAVTSYAGHSVGFHRRLIHRSFDCPKWLERVQVWLGTAVGMGGPLWTIRLRDSRDWARRACRPVPALLP